MKKKLVTIAHFDSYIEADLARQVLEDEGIKAFVMGQNVGNVYAGVPAATDIELQTSESEVERAREILAAHKQESEEAAEFDDEQDLEDEEEGELEADEDDEPQEDQE